MGMGSPYQKKKIVRLDKICTHFQVIPCTLSGGKRDMIKWLIKKVENLKY
ncbi:hypothetical protein B4147_5158 [Bacillus wiedmannii]|uniref:Uncharacterized protein n=1 Tax=Bacillus wiedmannii TaxID=1890302 RepID=A0A0G8C819_9BACI|nr:hypothetical protein B4147_5158 [Bacillus wiedmannii]